MDDVKQRLEGAEQLVAIGAGGQIRQGGQELHIANQVRDAELYSDLEVLHGLAVGREVAAAALSGWRAFSIPRDADGEWPELALRLEAVGPRSGLRASVTETLGISVSDAAGKPLRTLEPAHPGSLIPTDFTGMGFSGDESMLALSALLSRGGGDVFFIWQVLSVEHGLELFPLSTRYDNAGGPVMLRDLFYALEPVGWTGDDSALVLAAAEDLPYNIDDGMSGNNWFVRKGAPGGYYQLPLRWSNQPVPAWFLDAVSHLIHLKQDAGLGLEPVQPLSHSLQRAIRSCWRNRRLIRG